MTFAHTLYENTLRLATCITDISLQRKTTPKLYNEIIYILQHEYWFVEVDCEKLRTIALSCRLFTAKQFAQIRVASAIQFHDRYDIDDNDDYAADQRCFCGRSEYDDGYNS